MTDTSFLRLNMRRILLLLFILLAKKAAASSSANPSPRIDGSHLRVRKQKMTQKGQAGERILKKDDFLLKEQDIANPPTTSPLSAFPTMSPTTLLPTRLSITDVPTDEPRAKPTTSSVELITSPSSSESAVGFRSTSAPTTSGPVTRSPTGIPADVPTTVNAKTHTELPTAGSTSTSPVAIVLTHSPSVTPTIAVNEEKGASDKNPAAAEQVSSTMAVSLMPFRFDLVTTLSNARRLQSSNLRRLKEDNIFQQEQDISLLSILSFHLLIQFQQNLVGDPLMVELNIEEKSKEKQFDGLEAYYEEEAMKKKAENENVAGLDVEERSNNANFVEKEPALVMISYTFSGTIVYSGDATTTTITLPSSLELETETLRAFRSESGKQSLMKAFGRSDDQVLRAVADVDVTRDDAIDGGNSVVESMWNDPNFPKDYYGGDEDLGFSSNEIQEINGANDNSDNKSQGGQMNAYFIALIGLAFGSIFILIAFLGYRKYKQHQHKPYRKSSTKAKKDSASKRKKLKVDTFDSDRLRQYKPMESPESSFITSAESPVGADTYQTSSRDGSELFTSSGSGSPTNNQIDGDSNAAQNDESVPHDDASYDMPYLSQISKTTGFHSSFLCNTESRDETLDGLYSDKDSYFENSVMSSSHNRQNSFQGRPRAGSKDTTDTYGHDLSYDFEECDETAPHIVEGIQEVIEGNGGNVPFQLDHKNMSPDNDITMPPSPPRDTLQTLSTFIDQPILERSNEDHDDEDSPQKAEFSVTENLFARISGLEHMIQNSQNILMEEEQHDASESSAAKDMVMNEDEGDKVLSKSASDYERVEIYNTKTPSSSSQICSGIFTKETLGEINRSRLNATPPPSEGDYDEEISNVASVTSLLGNLDDSDEEAQEEDEQIWMFER